MGEAIRLNGVESPETGVTEYNSLLLVSVVVILNAFRKIGYEMAPTGKSFQ
jgi:hypothetical protein